jgi:hypothetical protein
LGNVSALEIERTGRREGGKGENAIFVRKTERKFVASGGKGTKPVQLKTEG